MSHPFVRALLSTLAMVACTTQPSEPGAGSGDVVYVVGESASLFVVDPKAGRVLAQPSAPPELKLTPVLSNDSSTLFFTKYDSTSAIYSLTAPGFALQRLLDLTPPPDAPAGSLWISGYALAIAPGHDGLFGYGAVVRDTVYPANVPCCLVEFDPVSRSVKEAIGLSGFTRLTALPAGPVAPSGGLVAMISSRYDPAILTWIAVVDPSTRTVIDSLAVPMPKMGVVEQAQSLVAAPGGRRIYILGWFGIYGYDLLTRQLIGFIDTSANDLDFDPHLAVSPDGHTVYLSTVFETPYGTTRPPTTVRVFDENLVERHPMALFHQYGANTPIFHGMLVSRDGASLYLLAGDRDFFGEGEDRVMVLNVQSGKVTRVIPLGVYAQAQILLGHL